MSRRVLTGRKRFKGKRYVSSFAYLDLKRFLPAPRARGQVAVTAAEQRCPELPRSRRSALHGFPLRGLYQVLANASLVVHCVVSELEVFDVVTEAVERILARQ